MTKIWKKLPRITRICACGCGESVTGTSRRMYARPYCKLKAHLERKKDPNFVPDSRFDPTRVKENPLAVVLPFTLGEETQEKPTNWWKERFGSSESVSSRI